MAIEFRKVSAKMGSGGGGVRKGYYLCDIAATPSPTTNPKYLHQIALVMTIKAGVTEDGDKVDAGTFRYWMKIHDYDKQTENAADFMADLLTGAIQSANPENDVAAELSGTKFEDDEAGLAKIASLLDGKSAPVHYEPRDLRRDKGDGNWDGLDWLSGDQYSNALSGAFRIAAKVVRGDDMSRPAQSAAPSNGGGLVVPPKKTSTSAVKNVNSLLGA